MKFSQSWISYIFIFAYAIGSIICLQNLMGGQNYQGDIKLTEEQQQQLNSRALAPIDINIWKDGIVPYTFAPGHFDDYAMAFIRNEMDIIEKQTKTSLSDNYCIKFVPRTIEEDYIEIINGGGCWSSLGRSGGKQELSLLYPGNPYDGTCILSGFPAHEFMHALGFDHEQNRPDRDQYIKVNLENLEDRNLIIINY